MAGQPVDHFGPLSPALGAAVGHEPVQQLGRALAPAQAHERADVAQLVRCISVVRHLPAAALLEERPVAFERQSQGLHGQHTRRLHGRERDGRAGGVEVAQVRAAGHVADGVRLHGRLGSRREVVREFIAARAHPVRVLMVAELLREPGAVLVAAQREQVVPVGVHGLGGIALVADRRRQQTKIGRVLRSAPLGRAPLGAQCVHVSHGCAHVWPYRFDRGAIVRQAQVLGSQEDEFAVAVVLGHRVRTAAVDTARDFPVGILECGEPFQVVLHRIAHARAEQRRGRERAVADPRALIRTRARLDAGAVAVHEHKAELGLERACHFGAAAAGG